MAVQESKPELGTWNLEAPSVSIRRVRRALQSDVLKILAYVVAAILLGSLLAPWLYTLGKALAEVTRGKQTNGFLEWVASACRNAEFPRFFNRALLLSALVLLFPLVQWLRMDRGRQAHRDTPWSLRLPETAIATNEGQPLKRNLRGPQQLLLGWVVAAGGLLLLGLALVQAGAFVWRNSALAAGIVPVNGWKVVRSAMGPAVFVSVIEEILFRGVLLGLFMRAMRPSSAIISVSLLFAFVHFLQPPLGVVVPDPESPTAGLWLIWQIIGRFARPLELISGFATLTAIGLVLGHARWRTASLWLPVGLHTGWIFGVVVFKAITWAAPGAPPGSSWLIGSTLREGLMPLAVVLVTGLVVQRFTRVSRDGSEPCE
jgi:membrane protease YdiL (CAAX protease family)